jgi:hypothetical protein
VLADGSKHTNNDGTEETKAIASATTTPTEGHRHEDKPTRRRDANQKQREGSIPSSTATEHIQASSSTPAKPVSFSIQCKSTYHLVNNQQLEQSQQDIRRLRQITKPSQCRCPRPSNCLRKLLKTSTTIVSSTSQPKWNAAAKANKNAGGSEQESSTRIDRKSQRQRTFQHWDGDSNSSNTSDLGDGTKRHMNVSSNSGHRAGRRRICANRTCKTSSGRNARQRTSKIAVSPAERNFNAHDGKYLYDGPNTTTCGSNIKPRFQRRHIRQW